MDVKTSPLEPWQWPDDHWRKLVNHVRAGRAFRPRTWKDNARCAVALSFDSDHETNELRDGGKSIGRLCWGQFGNRVGVPRILTILRRYDVKATFFVPAVAALLHPDEQRHVVAEGHEIGIHGWIHELNSVLPYQGERDLLLRSADALEKITGVRPVGLRTPSWDFSPNTLAIEKEMRLFYDSSLMERRAANAAQRRRPPPAHGPVGLDTRIEHKATGSTLARGSRHQGAEIRDVRLKAEPDRRGACGCRAQFPGKARLPWGLLAHAPRCQPCRCS